MRWKKASFSVAAGLVGLFLLFSIPGRESNPAPVSVPRAFTWNQDERWKSLATQFRSARAAGCQMMRTQMDRQFRIGQRHLEALSVSAVGHSSALWNEVEDNVFSLGAAVAACAEKGDEYIKLVAAIREGAKLQSKNWDAKDRSVHDRLYRLLYGGRAALEEVMLQMPKGSYPPVIHGRKEASATPSFTYEGVTLHSGDVLVSRGGAPTSALIARGNDYPGNFSHVALFYVNPKTGRPSIVESHIERGVVISSMEEYLKDKKLRILVLRLRADHPRMLQDPLLPHRAAEGALAGVKQRHIPYDFAMDFRDPSKMFCSEVVSSAYGALGVNLWQIPTTMSSPGLVRWLFDFGVRFFETQAPADLEYDSQLSVVAEWRDPDALWDDHVDNAVVDAILEGADRGDRLTYPWYLLAPARIVKGFCSALNLVGRVGPIPEGMAPEGALRNLRLGAIHKETKRRVLSKAAPFEEEHGHRPAYWDLVGLAAQAYKEFKETEGSWVDSP